MTVARYWVAQHQGAIGPSKGESEHHEKQSPRNWQENVDNLIWNNAREFLPDSSVGKFAGQPIRHRKQIWFWTMVRQSGFFASFARVIARANAWRIARAVARDDGRLFETIGGFAGSFADLCRVNSACTF